jgi:hypothetical protein
MNIKIIKIFILLFLISTIGFSQVYEFTNIDYIHYENGHEWAVVEDEDYQIIITSSTEKRNTYIRVGIVNKTKDRIVVSDEIFKVYVSKKKKRWFRSKIYNYEQYREFVRNEITASYRGMIIGQAIGASFGAAAAASGGDVPRTRSPNIRAPSANQVNDEVDNASKMYLLKNTVFKGESIEGNLFVENQKKNPNYVDIEVHLPDKQYKFSMKKL